jgi:hypothetical protein
MEQAFHIASQEPFHPNEYCTISSLGFVVLQSVAFFLRSAYYNGTDPQELLCLIGCKVQIFCLLLDMKFKAS